MLKIKMRTEENSWGNKEIMEIWHKGKLIAEYSDGGEPEDNTFGRDWDWVSEAIEKAYKLGVQDKQDEWDKAYVIRIAKEKEK